MGLLNKLMDTMRLNGDDDYFDDDEEYEMEKPARRNVFSGSRDDDDDYEEEEERPRFFSRSSSSKVVPMKRSMEVSLLRPSTIEEGSSIVDDLLAGKAVVLNMEGIQMEAAQRIIDFTSGAAYSMNGNLQKISNYIFIVTPESVELSGGFQEILNKSSNLDVSGLNIHL